MKMFIDGAWTASDGGDTFPVTNPADGSVVGHAPDGTATDADRAIRAAARAFETWRAVPLPERAALQHRLAGAMRAAAERIGAALHQELGRPLPGCLSEVRRAADMLDVYAEEALRLRAEMPLDEGPGRKTIVTREPLGVAVAITPFNFPIMLLCLKLGGALAAGCTMVAKPSEETPLSTLLLAEVLHEAGLPAGVFNVVTGRGPGIGAALVAHPVPRKIAFTGGTEAGKAIAAAALGTMKRLTLELGGHCPAIVSADADLEAATRAIVAHGFRNSGQLCYRVNRVFVEEPLYEAFVTRLAERTSELTLAPAGGGPGDLGPLISDKILATSQRHATDAARKGARILTGGARAKGPGFDGGYYFEPTIIADARPDMAIMREETFGPLIGVAPVARAEEAVRLANDSPFGLAAFVFARDLARGLTLCEALDAGSVWLNDIDASSPYVPFGGVKQSGIGREKGRHGVEAYLEWKTMYLSYAVPA